MTPDILHAIDRLNSWVRSPSYAPSWNGPRNAIYWLKGQAIQKAHESGSATHRNVFIRVKCRDCAGTGRFVDFQGYTHDHCWACDSSGTATLRFVETTLATGQRWHSPSFGFPVREWKYDEPEAVEAIDWTVNQPGNNMEPHEVAACLTLVERAIVSRPRPTWRGTDYSDGYLDDPFAYRLDVGSTDPKTCSLCGAPAGECSFAARRHRLVWSDHACEGCEALYYHGGELFSRFPVPQHLVSHPAIVEWIVDHPVKETSHV